MKLWLVKSGKSVLERRGQITGKGAFKLTYEEKHAGTRTFVVTYKAGTTFKSNEIAVTVKK